MFDKEDYQALLDRARRKRNQHPYTMYAIFAAGAVLAILLIIGIGVLVSRQFSKGAAATEPGQQIQAAQESTTADPLAESRAKEESLRAEEESRQAMEAAERQAVVDAYGNLGFVQVSGYLNVRRSPDPSGEKKVRPLLPLPPLCCSARRTISSFCPSDTYCFKTVLVELTIRSAFT